MSTRVRHTQSIILNSPDGGEVIFRIVERMAIDE